ncbi:MAG: amino acid ABC transporter substrate-binding protein [Alphaproteobacteria bacterium]
MFRVALCAVTAAMLSAPDAYADTLDRIRDRGHVVCGINTGLAGFAEPDQEGDWKGFDIDYCRALAAAIFDDPGAVRFRPSSPQDRSTVLQSGEVDVLARNTTWTLTRDAKWGDFVGVNYYDGQGFLVPKSLGVKSAKELDGARICIQTGTTTELNLADYFRANGMEFESVVVKSNDEVRATYSAESCDSFTTDVSGLAAIRSTLDDPSAHIILPEIVSKEPLGPLVRHGDDQWADVARWVLNALIIAEELGVTSENAGKLRKQDKRPAVRRLLGVEGAYGEQIGLSDDWAYNVIRHVGNYGEIFERHLGKETPLGLKRGQNALWKDGGLIYAPPMR